MPELKKGYQGPLYNPWYDWAFNYAKSYNFLLGKRDGYYGAQEAAFVMEMQRRLGIVIDGKFGDRTAAAVHYTWPGSQSPPVVTARRKIWFYSNPGSGSNEFAGPSFQLGERIKNVLHINHQPVHSALGGYLGFMGGPPDLSYVEVTWDELKSIEWLLDNNPDINDPDLELWFSGYSQKADGLEDAIEVLFGDGGFIHPGDKTRTPSPPGKYRHLRGRINGIIQFGNPSTKDTGIANKVRPAWVYALVHNINYANDFYAVAPDKIRRLFYAEIIKAEMELPFFVHVLRIAVPVIMSWAATIMPIFGPLLGGFGPMVQMALGTLGGLQGMGSNSLFSGFMGQAGSGVDQDSTSEIEELLSPTGVLTNIPGLIGLIGALPGLQAHGGYEFDQAMMDQAYNFIAGFHR